MDFKQLRFPVNSWQRSQLQQHKANAVAKEALLVARKREQFLQLQKYVLERIEGKILNQRHATLKSVQPDSGAVLGSGGSCPVRRPDRSPSSVLGGIARGYLTRRLLHSPRVQFITRTIKDSLVVLDSLHHPLTQQRDQQLKQRMLIQLSVARLDLHNIFFQLSPARQMSFLSPTHSTTTTTASTTNRRPGIKSTVPENPTAASHSEHSRLTDAGLGAAVQHSGGRTGSADGVGQGGRGGGGGVQGGGGGKLSAATIKCMQRRLKSARNK